MTTGYHSRTGTFSFEDLELGLVPGQRRVAKFGFNHDIDAGVRETLCSFGGVFVPKALTDAAETLSVVSGSANDAAAGTGAQTVCVDGLDTNYLEITEVVTMNGTTPVVTTNTFKAVNRVRTGSAGSGRRNAAAITLTGSDSSDILGQIPFSIYGRGITQQVIYTVPANKRLIVRKIYLGSGKDSGGGSPDVVFNLEKYDSSANVNIVLHESIIETAANNHDTIEDMFDIVLDEKDTIQVLVTSNAANTEVYGRLFGTLITPAELQQ